jgi:hypothetical protein
MRATCLSLALACSSACATSRPAAFVNTCTDYTSQPTDPNAARPSQDRILAQAHALFGALDRADEASFQAELGDSFALIDSGAVRDRAFLVQGIRERAARNAPERTRSWQNEQVWVSDHAAVFVGEAIVSDPGDPDHAGGDFAGWHTVVFAPERGLYRAMSWQWVPASFAVR